MSSEKKPAEFDWVTARYECSASVMFSKLRRDAETNIDRRNEQLGRSSPARFSLESDNDSFFVKRGDFCVGFRMDKSAGTISVEDTNGKLMMRASVSLNDDAECVLRVKDKELDRWQFLRRALDHFFFEFRRS